MILIFTFYLLLLNHNEDFNDGYVLFYVDLKTDDCQSNVVCSWLLVISPCFLGTSAMADTIIVYEYKLLYILYL